MRKKAEKKTQGEELRAQLATVSTVILSTFQGITVEQDTQLRRAVEAAGGHYQVVKNTVAERAAAGTPTEGLLRDLKGTNSIAYTKTDPVSLAKILTKVAKEVPAFQVPRRMGRGPGHFDSGNRPARAASEQGRADQQDHVPAERPGTACGDGAYRAAAESGSGDERSGEGEQVRAGWRQRSARTRSGSGSGPVKRIFRQSRISYLGGG